MPFRQNWGCFWDVLACYVALWSLIEVLFSVLDGVVFPGVLWLFLLVFFAFVELTFERSWSSMLILVSSGEALSTSAYDLSVF